MNDNDLNKIVAVKVMGWKWWRFTKETGLYPPDATWMPSQGGVLVDGPSTECPEYLGAVQKYSTNIACAWKVKQRVIDPINPLKRPDGQNASVSFVNQFEQAHLWGASEEEAAKHICVMALRAVGVSEAEIQDVL